MSTEINPNVPTTDTPATPTIEQTGGNTAISFDEFEQMDNWQARQEKTQKKTDTPQKGKDATQAKAQGGKEVSDEVTEDEADLPGEKNAKPTDKKDSKKPKDEKAEKRLVKMKSGDEEVEVDLQGKIPVKVNGQEVEVPLEELRNNYAGKISWSDRFAKLGRDEQKFNQTKGEFKKHIGEVMETSKTDAMGALIKLAELNGHDPIKWRQEFLKIAIPQVARIMEMTDDERKAADLEFENSLLKSRSESLTKQQAEEKGLADFKTHVETLQQTHQIDPEKFKETYHQLEQLQKSGELKKEITPELVVETVVAERIYSAVESVFTEMKNSDEAAIDKAFEHIRTVAKTNPELSLGDLKEITKEVFGKQKAQNLSRKVQAKGDAAKKSSKPVNPGIEPVSFDDL